MISGGAEDAAARLAAGSAARSFMPNRCPELRELRYFVAAAQDLHFTRAARRLHIAQQALSSTIQRLETRLGTALFERTTRQVMATGAGEALLAKAWLALARPRTRPRRRGTRLWSPRDCASPSAALMRCGAWT